MTGQEPDSGRWVAASSDDGLRWSTAPLPGRDGPVIETLAPVVGPADAYAVGTRTSGGRAALLAIFHSADRGETWRQTGVFGNTDRLPREVEVSIARRHDLVLFGPSADSGDHWRSTDHGRTLVPANLGQPLSAPRWTGGGYLAVVGHNPAARWFRSVDGIEWRELHFG